MDRIAIEEVKYIPLLTRSVCLLLLILTLALEEFGIETRPSLMAFDNAFTPCFLPRHEEPYRGDPSPAVTQVILAESDFRWTMALICGYVMQTQSKGQTSGASILDDMLSENMR